MASTIVTRTISAATETAIQMANSSWARPISIPSTWSKIRIGIRLHFTPSVSPGSGTTFALGLCSGTANVAGDQTVKHFMGVTCTGSYSIASSEFQNFAVATTTIVGTTTTLAGTNIFNNNIVFFPVNAAATADRTCMFIDITKGSPNFSIDAFMCNNTNDVSAATFLTQVQLASPVITNHAFSGTPRAVAVDEATNGTLNAVNCWWNSNVSMPEICDLAVVLLA